MTTFKVLTESKDAKCVALVDVLANAGFADAAVVGTVVESETPAIRVL